MIYDNSDPICNRLCIGCNFAEFVEMDDAVFNDICGQDWEMVNILEDNDEMMYQSYCLDNVDRLLDIINIRGITHGRN